MSGWGKTDIEATRTSPVLKDLNVMIFSNEECIEMKKDFYERYALFDGFTETEAKKARSQARVVRYITYIYYFEAQARVRQGLARDGH